MQISFDLPLEQTDLDKLCSVINCTAQDVEQTFSLYAKSAAEEYMQMFLGKNSFRRTVDFQDFRIYLIMIHVLNGNIPDEALISRLFQTSATESRARIRSVLSKYQRGLESQIKNSISEILQNAAAEEDRHIITVNNLTIVEMLNAKLAELDGNHVPVKKIRETVSSYSLAPASYNALISYYA